MPNWWFGSPSWAELSLGASKMLGGRRDARKEESLALGCVFRHVNAFSVVEGLRFSREFSMDRGLLHFDLPNSNFILPLRELTDTSCLNGSNPCSVSSISPTWRLPVRHRRRVVYFGVMLWAAAPWKCVETYLDAVWVRQSEREGGDLVGFDSFPFVEVMPPRHLLRHRRTQQPVVTWLSPANP